MENNNALDLYNNVYDKERLIVSGIIACNNQISKLQSQSKLFEDLIDSNKTNLYKYNMMNLYSSIVHTDFIGLNESHIDDSFDYIKNTHDNYYAYFTKMSNFLSGYEIPVQQTLNESLFIPDTQVKNPTQIDIVTFKQDLADIINKLASINEVGSLTQQTLKIKTLSHIPTYVFGYNIMNNDKLEPSIKEYMRPESISMVVYDAYNKGLCFVGRDGFVFYDLKTDLFTFKKYSFKIDANLFQTFKHYTGINYMIELYFDSSLLNMKFTNNLYNDQKYQQMVDMENKKRSQIFN
jgi:hypothetical protein